MKTTAMKILGCVLALFATAVPFASVTGDVQVDAADVSWDAQPNLPDELKAVVRWKTLIGGEDVPHSEFFFGELELAPGAIYPGHLHPAPEMYYVLEGRIEWTVGDETFIAEPGTALYTAPSTVHRMVNLGDGIARAVWAWWAPGGDTSVMGPGYRITETLPSQPASARFPDAR